MDSRKARLDILTVWGCHFLSMRESVSSLFELARRENNTFGRKDESEFDFKSINWVSRSFAEEFLKNVDILKNTLGMTISVTNVSPEVKKMLDSVKMSRIKKNRPTEEFDRLTFADPASLEGFLAPL